MGKPSVLPGYFYGPQLLPWTIVTFQMHVENCKAQGKLKVVFFNLLLQRNLPQMSALLMEPYR